jgi:hypothetical protein
VTFAEFEKSERNVDANFKYVVELVNEYHRASGAARWEDAHQTLVDANLMTIYTDVLQLPATKTGIRSLYLHRGRT